MSDTLIRDMAHEVELKALATYLEQNNLKHTKQRELILTAFLEAKRHVTGEDLYQSVREQHSNIGYTTVYRTMKLLVEAGLATERHFDDDHPTTGTASDAFTVDITIEDSLGESDMATSPTVTVIGVPSPTHCAPGKKV